LKKEKVIPELMKSGIPAETGSDGTMLHSTAHLSVACISVGCDCCLILNLKKHMSAFWKEHRAAGCVSLQVPDYSPFLNAHSPNLPGML
jgi:hypothetical protein